MVNIFLNTRVRQAKGLEKAASNILAGVRIIWRGKTVTINETSGIRSRDSFKDVSFFYKVLAVLSLPVAVPLGSFLKGCSFLSSTTRVNHDLVKEYFKPRILEKSARPLIDVIRSPSQLIESAVVEAYQELLDEGEINNADLERPSSELRRKAARLAIINMLLEAKIEPSACTDWLILEGGIKVKDAVQCGYIRNSDGKYVAAYYRDLFSGWNKGTKPLSAKRALDDLDESDIEEMKEIIISGDPDVVGEYAKVFKLLDPLSLQLESRYMRSFKLTVREGSVCCSTAKIKVSHPQLNPRYDQTTSVYELLELELLRQVQEQIQTDRLTKGQLEDAILDMDPWKIVGNALYQILDQSVIVDRNGNADKRGRNLQLAPHVTLNFSSRTLYADKKGTVNNAMTCLPNDLTGVHVRVHINDEALLIRRILDRLSDEGHDLFKKLLDLEHQGKPDTEIQELIEEEGSSEKEELLQALRHFGRLRGLCKERYFDELQRHLCTDLEPFKFEYYEGKIEESDDLKASESPKDEEEEIEASDDDEEKVEEEGEVKASEKSENTFSVEGGVQYQYLPELIAKPIEPQPFVVRKVKNKISKRDIKKAGIFDGKDLVKRQYKVIENHDHTHSCLFGAVAQALYCKNPGKSKFDPSDSIEHMQALRQAVANYLKENWEDYKSQVEIGKSDEYFSYNHDAWVTAENDSDEAKKDAIFQRADNIARLNRYHTIGVWADEVEIGILAEIFGRPIHIFDESGLEVGDKGELTPQRILGDHIDAEPIRLLFQVNHFELMLPK